MDREMVRYLAQLSRLSFTDEELEKMADDMTGIIEIMDTIKEVDVTYDSFKEDHNVYLNDLRKDITADSYPTANILQNAVNSEDAFVVPKVVE